MLSIKVYYTCNFVGLKISTKYIIKEKKRKEKKRKERNSSARRVQNK